LILRVFYFTLCCGKWRTLRPGSAGLGFYQVGNLRSHFPIRRFPFKVADPRIDSTRLLRVSVMSLRLRKKPPAPSLQRRRQLEITVLAHNQALHYLANHPLTEDEVLVLPPRRLRPLDHKSELSHRHRTCQCELPLKISPAKWNYWTI